MPVCPRAARVALAHRYCTALPALLLALGPVAAGSQPEWQMSFYHDEDDSSLSIHELRFPAPGRGVALGWLHTARGSRKPAIVETTDGGATWSHRTGGPAGRSLFFLDERTVWMVAEDGLYRSRDAGVRWERLFRNRLLTRCWFLDERRGFAIGMERTALATTDGGTSWQPIPAAGEIKTDRLRSVFTWVEFAGRTGFIVGAHIPRQPVLSELPDWMDPGAAKLRRQLPASTLMLQTLDGGATWKASASSTFGRLTRFRPGPGGLALNLIEFDQTFDWPSEVYVADLRAGRLDRVHRVKDRAVTDVAFLPAGGAVLAATEAVGGLRGSPIPGALKMILVSADFKSWRETEADYRAVAHRCVLAVDPAGGVWVATDTGMILRLRHDAPAAP